MLINRLLNFLQTGSVLRRLCKFALLVVMVFHLWVLACLAWWSVAPVQRTMFMHIYALSDQGPAIQHQWVSYNRMSSHIKRALVTSEDGKFMLHNGFDVDAIKNAVKRNDKKGRVVRGGSTISQQLCKNLFLFNKRSYIRKAEEAVITLMMETLWSKKRILTVYLNSIEFGRGIYGVEAAAQHYFNTSAAKLSKDQSARLAAMVPNPKYYQQHKTKRYNRKVAAIKRYMHTATIPK